MEGIAVPQLSKYPKVDYVCYDVDYYTLKEWVEQASLWHDEAHEAFNQWCDGVIIKKYVSLSAIHEGLELRMYDVKLSDGLIIRKVQEYEQGSIEIRSKRPDTLVDGSYNRIFDQTGWETGTIIAVHKNDAAPRLGAKKSKQASVSTFDIVFQDGHIVRNVPISDTYENYDRKLIHCHVYSTEDKAPVPGEEDKIVDTEPEVGDELRVRSEFHVGDPVSLRYGPCLTVKQGRELQRVEVPKQPPLQDQVRTYSLVSLSGLEPLQYAGDKEALQALHSFYNVKDGEKYGFEKVVGRIKREEEEVRRRVMKRDQEEAEMSKHYNPEDLKRSAERHTKASISEKREALRAKKKAEEEERKRLAEESEKNPASSEAGANEVEDGSKKGQRRGRNGTFIDPNSGAPAGGRRASAVADGDDGEQAGVKGTSGITSIAESKFEMSFNIKSIDLSNQLLMNLNGLDKLPSIEKVVAHHNRIVKVFFAMDHGRDTVPEDFNLTCASLDLSEYYAAFRNLKFLDLSYNNLVEVPPLHVMPSLEVLKLQHNKIVSGFPLFCPGKKLRILDISYNRLQWSVEIIRNEMKDFPINLEELTIEHEDGKGYFYSSDEVNWNKWREYVKASLCRSGKAHKLEFVDGIPIKNITDYTDQRYERFEKLVMQHYSLANAKVVKEETKTEGKKGGATASGVFTDENSQTIKFLFQQLLAHTKAQLTSGDPLQIKEAADFCTQFMCHVRDNFNVSKGYSSYDLDNTRHMTLFKLGNAENNESLLDQVTEFFDLIDDLMTNPTYGGHGNIKKDILSSLAHLSLIKLTVNCGDRYGRMELPHAFGLMCLNKLERLLARSVYDTSHMNTAAQKETERDMLKTLEKFTGTDTEREAKYSYLIEKHITTYEPTRIEKSTIIYIVEELLLPMFFKLRKRLKLSDIEGLLANETFRPLVEDRIAIHEDYTLQFQFILLNIIQKHDLKSCLRKYIHKLMAQFEKGDMANLDFIAFASEDPFCVKVMLLKKMDSTVQKFLMSDENPMSDTLLFYWKMARNLALLDTHEKIEVENMVDLLRAEHSRSRSEIFVKDIYQGRSAKKMNQLVPKAIDVLMKQLGLYRRPLKLRPGQDPPPVKPNPAVVSTMLDFLSSLVTLHNKLGLYIMNKKDSEVDYPLDLSRIIGEVCRKFPHPKSLSSCFGFIEAVVSAPTSWFTVSPKVMEEEAYFAFIQKLCSRMNTTERDGGGVTFLLRYIVNTQNSVKDLCKVLIGGGNRFVTDHLIEWYIKYAASGEPINFCSTDKLREAIYLFPHSMEFGIREEVVEYDQSLKMNISGLKRLHNFFLPNTGILGQDMSGKVVAASESVGCYINGHVSYEDPSSDGTEEGKDSNENVPRNYGPVRRLEFTEKGTFTIKGDNGKASDVTIQYVLSRKDLIMLYEEGLECCNLIFSDVAACSYKACNVLRVVLNEARFQQQLTLDLPSPGANFYLDSYSKLMKAKFHYYVFNALQSTNAKIRLAAIQCYREFPMEVHAVETVSALVETIRGLAEINEAALKEIALYFKLFSSFVVTSHPIGGEFRSKFAQKLIKGTFAILEYNESRFENTSAEQSHSSSKIVLTQALVEFLRACSSDEALRMFLRSLVHEKKYCGRIMRTFVAEANYNKNYANIVLRRWLNSQSPEFDRNKIYQPTGFEQVAGIDVSILLNTISLDASNIKARLYVTFEPATKPFEESCMTLGNVCTSRLIRRIAEILEGAPQPPMACWRDIWFPESNTNNSSRKVLHKETYPVSSRAYGPYEMGSDDNTFWGATFATIQNNLNDRNEYGIDPLYAQYSAKRIFAVLELLGDASGRGAKEYALRLEDLDQEILTIWEHLNDHQRQSVYVFRNETSEETLHRLKEHYLFSRSDGIDVILSVLLNSSKSTATTTSTTANDLARSADRLYELLRDNGNAFVVNTAGVSEDMFSYKHMLASHIYEADVSFGTKAPHHALPTYQSPSLQVAGNAFDSMLSSLENEKSSCVSAALRCMFAALHYGSASKRRETIYKIKSLNVLQTLYNVATENHVAPMWNEYAIGCKLVMLATDIIRTLLSWHAEGLDSSEKDKELLYPSPEDELVSHFNTFETIMKCCSNMFLYLWTNLNSNGGYRKGFLELGDRRLLTYVARAVLSVITEVPTLVSKASITPAEDREKLLTYFVPESIIDYIYNFMLFASCVEVDVDEDKGSSPPTHSFNSSKATLYYSEEAAIALELIVVRCIIWSPLRRHELLLKLSKVASSLTWSGHVRNSFIAALLQHVEMGLQSRDLYTVQVMTMGCLFSSIEKELGAVQEKCYLLVEGTGSSTDYKPPQPVMEVQPANEVPLPAPSEEDNVAMMALTNLGLYIFKWYVDIVDGRKKLYIVDSCKLTNFKNVMMGLGQDRIHVWYKSNKPSTTSFKLADGSSYFYLKMNSTVICTTTYTSIRTVLSELAIKFNLPVSGGDRVPLRSLQALYRTDKIHLYTPCWLVTGEPETLQRVVIVLFDTHSGAHGKAGSFGINSTFAICSEDVEGWLVHLEEWERKEKEGGGTAKEIPAPKTRRASVSNIKRGSSQLTGDLQDDVQGLNQQMGERENKVISRQFLSEIKKISMKKFIEPAFAGVHEPAASMTLKFKETKGGKDAAPVGAASGDGSKKRGNIAMFTFKFLSDSNREQWRRYLKAIKAPEKE